jgi:protein-disulfide isomerase
MQGPATSSRWFDRIATGSGFVLLGLAALILGRPTGPLGRIVSARLEASRVRQVVQENWHQLAAGRGVLGAASSPPVLIEFIDYQCAYCRALHDTVSHVLSAGLRAIVIRQLPRLGDPRSRAAALAAVCADEQGHFAHMHHFLLTHDTWITDVRGRELAKAAGLADVERFASCIESDYASKAISADSSWARRLGIAGTPTLLTRQGRLHTGIAQVAALETLMASHSSPQPGR